MTTPSLEFRQNSLFAPVWLTSTQERTFATRNATFVTRTSVATADKDSRARESPRGTIDGQEVLVDEGKHVKNGRKLLERYCTTEEQQRRVVAISEKTFEEICACYEVDFYGAIKAEAD